MSPNARWRKRSVMAGLDPPIHAQDAVFPVILGSGPPGRVSKDDSPVTRPPALSPGESSPRTSPTRADVTSSVCPAERWQSG